MSTDDFQTDLKNKAASMMNDLFEGKDPQEKIKGWANDTRQLIEKNPWLAIAGALAVGYLLGTIKSRSQGEDQ